MPATPAHVFRNNFDLIRLIAAIQVVLVHSLEHLTIGSGPYSVLIYYLGLIPGVPIFFFVSGFLVSGSYLRLNSVSEFFRRRALRIFPGLWVCFFVSVILVTLTGYLFEKSSSPIDFVVWAIAQLSFIQFYNPQFLRGFGVGTLNGSLWTISVEIQFYILVPFLLIAFRKFKWLYVSLLLISLFTNILFIKYDVHDNIIYKIVGVTFIPWIFHFLLGQITYLYWDKISLFFKGRLMIWALFYLTIFAFIFINHGEYSELRLGNKLPPYLVVFLFLFILSCAFTFPNVAIKILNGNDISYGVYLYHMPIINVILFYNYASGTSAIFTAVFLTFVAATLSWYLVEKPFLKLKH